jgi:PPOX class probable F420-dependent enzyme
MPAAPLTPELERFVRAPRPAVMSTLRRRDGAPVTTPTWYDWDDGLILLSMVASSPRTSNVRADPRIALTILADSWYSHVSLLGRIVDVRDDTDLAVLDRLSERYWGKPYTNRELVCIAAWTRIDRYHSFGSPEL